MSENGKYLIVGAPLDWTGVTTDFHYAEIFEFNDEQWTRKGDKIYGLTGNTFGYDVEINHDGSRVAISSPQNENCPIQIFDYNDSNWELKGVISYDTQPSNFGRTMAMTPNGKNLIATSRLQNGVARIYLLEELLQPDCPEEQIEQEPEVEESVNLYVPNVIKLNANSSKNSTFFAQSKFEINYSLKIFDRWGNIIFTNDQATTNNITDGWLPSNKNSQGVYVYLITFNDGKENCNKAGDLTLIK